MGGDDGGAAAEVAEAVKAGTWTPGAFYGNMADGMVNIAPLGPSVSAEMAALIETGRVADATGDVLPGHIGG